MEKWHVILNRVINDTQITINHGKTPEKGVYCLHNSLQITTLILFYVVIITILQVENF